MHVLQPEDRYALIRLSAGKRRGYDQRVRLAARDLCRRGFPVAAFDRLGGMDRPGHCSCGARLGSSTVAKSGYSFLVKQWKRGTPLSAAHEVYRGKPEQNGTYPRVLHDSQGHVSQCIDDNLAFFANVIYVRTASGFQALGMPLHTDVSGLLDGQILMRLH